MYVETLPMRWALGFRLPSTTCISDQHLKGEKQEYWDNIMFCVFGRVPDSHHLSPLFLILVPSDLSEPVDVYSDWIDACEAANQ
ncbi:Transcription elongation factor 1-like [Oryzias melastigma]|uniref:Transcription elongation factor 1-like n=1 Tax=Oryzias melastigma TaxID=30732 RepID=A0A834BV94_ORYME|nr:Transcription elongation factor 1-like [Oryzias melastigma]